MKKTKSTYLALLAVLLSPMAANADPVTVTYDFEAFDFDLGLFDSTPAPMDPVTGSFSFTYDSAGSILDGTLTGIDLLIMSHLYDVADVGLDISGPETFFLGGLITGLNGTGPFTNDFVLFLDFTDGELSYGSFLYRVDSLFDGWLTENVVAAEHVSVPEPGTLALLGIGLLGMGLTRRRKTV